MTPDDNPPPSWIVFPVLIVAIVLVMWKTLMVVERGIKHSWAIEAARENP